MPQPMQKASGECTTVESSLNVSLHVIVGNISIGRRCLQFSTPLCYGIKNEHNEYVDYTLVMLKAKPATAKGYLKAL